ncbi:MAG: FMN-binding protein [Candidatus Glassbacteria bacterium]|nr:FMN-binding protein [Candidatus Glassbacteria bacterium]
MRELIKLSGILMLITLTAATALSNVYLLTRDRIAAVELAREENARRAALPAAVYFEADTLQDGFVLYRGYDNPQGSGTPVGYTVLALGKGYSSTIRTVVGMDAGMNITGIKVAFQQETPGLGTKVEEIKGQDKEPWFQKQFRGKREDQLVVVRTKNPEAVEAITGATISSTAVTRSVREAVRKLKEVLKES